MYSLNVKCVRRQSHLWLYSGSSRYSCGASETVKSLKNVWPKLKCEFVVDVGRDLPPCSSKVS